MKKETKIKISKTLKRKLKAGLIPNHFKFELGHKLSKETKDKISKKLTGRKFSDKHRLSLSLAKKGRTSPNKGKKITEEQKQKIRQTLLKKRHILVQNGIKSHLLQASHKGYTSIERWLYNYLDQMGVEYFKQAVIGNFIVDAYIPCMGTVVEMDGDYWHNLPENKARDIKKDKYLLELGYSVLRMKESEVKQGKDLFTNLDIYYA